MKILWPLLEKGPGVQEFVDWLLGPSVFYVSACFQDFHWIWIDYVYHEDRLLVIFAEKQSKGKCVLSEKTADNLMK